MYYVYILKCVDETLYTGIAVDLKKRIDENIILLIWARNIPDIGDQFNWYIQKSFVIVQQLPKKRSGLSLCRGRRSWR